MANTFIFANFQTFQLAFVSALFCVATPKAHAEIEIPKLSAPVIDDGGFFSPQEEQTISRKIRVLYDAGGPQLQVWTVRSLEGEPIESLSMRAADVWKLGRADKDDGLLLSLAREERRFRLEVGQGLEGTIPDVLAARMLRQILVPALRRSKTAEGVSALIAEIATLTINDKSRLEATELAKDRPGAFSSIVTSLVYLLFLLSVVVGALFQSRSPEYRRSRAGRGWRGGGGWHGGGGGWSGGGGGWSGGGGGFSGGGSSGGW